MSWWEFKYKRHTVEKTGSYTSTYLLMWLLWEAQYPNFHCSYAHMPFLLLPAFLHSFLLSLIFLILLFPHSVFLSLLFSCFYFFIFLGTGPLLPSLIDDQYAYMNYADMFLALDKDMNGTLSKQELREYADGTLTDIFIERGKTESAYAYAPFNVSFLRIYGMFKMCGPLQLWSLFLTISFIFCNYCLKLSYRSHSCSSHWNLAVQDTYLTLNLGICFKIALQSKLGRDLAMSLLLILGPNWWALVPEWVSCLIKGFPCQFLLWW